MSRRIAARCLYTLLMVSTTTMGNPINPDGYWGPGSVTDTAMQSANPRDTMLVAYSLTSQQVQQFSLDNRMSTFWGDFAAADSVEIALTQQCRSGPCWSYSSNDARVTVKAAAAPSGLFILAIARDDRFIDVPDTTSWQFDTLELYFDVLSSTVIRTCTDCLIDTLLLGQLSYYTGILKFPLSAALGAGLRMSYYDENLWSWLDLGTTADALWTLYGIRTDRFNANVFTRGVEIFMPWERFAMHGLPLRPNLTGLILAFTAGYSDIDTAGQPPARMYWFGNCPYDSTNERTWGDIYVNPLPPLQPPIAVQRGRGAEVRFGTQAQQTVELTVYGLDGSLVRRVLRSDLAPGQHAWAWDGRDERGRRVRPGHYVARLQTGTVSQSVMVTVGR